MEVENENTDQVTEYINKLFTKNVTILSFRKLVIRMLSYFRSLIFIILNLVSNFKVMYGRNYLVRLRMTIRFMDIELILFLIC